MKRRPQTQIPKRDSFELANCPLVLGGISPRYKWPSQWKLRATFGLVSENCRNLTKILIKSRIENIFSLIKLRRFDPPVCVSILRVFLASEFVWHLKFHLADPLVERFVQSIRAGEYSDLPHSTCFFINAVLFLLFIQSLFLWGFGGFWANRCAEICLWSHHGFRDFV